MPVIFVKGDLFLSDVQTIAHGVNCKGRMGAGIAVQFKSKYPEMYKKYRNLCHKNILRPGGVYLEKETIPWVLNLATQADLGGARIEYIADCFKWIAENYENEGIKSLAMPRIGAGLGRLDWDDVKTMIYEFLDPLPVKIIIYEEYVE